MKLVYKYTSDLININTFKLIYKTVLENFKEIQDYNLVSANIITEGKTICKVMFIKGAEDKDDFLIDYHTIDYKHIDSSPEHFYTISCSRCGQTYLGKEELSYNNYLGCSCYSPDVDFNSNDTTYYDITNYVFKPELDIYIEYYVYTYA
jgi:hypothetical protein